MAEIFKEEIVIEEFETKEEKVSIKKDVLPSSTVEAIFTVNLHKDDKKIENKGKFNNFYNTLY